MKSMKALGISFAVAAAAMMIFASQPLFAGYRAHFGYHGHFRHVGYYGHHGYYGYYPHYRFYGYPYAYSFYGYPGYYGHYGHPYYSQKHKREALRQLAVAGLGALNLNVKPKKVQVYLNACHVGKAGKFDGTPGYLWLKEGNYELIFYRDGYSTVVQNITVRPGMVIDVKQRLQEGDSVRPKDLTSKSCNTET